MGQKNLLKKIQINLKKGPLSLWKRKRIKKNADLKNRRDFLQDSFNENVLEVKIVD